MLRQKFHGPSAVYRSFKAGRIRGRHQFLTNTQRILVQAKLHRVISRFIHYLVEKKLSVAR